MSHISYIRVANSGINVNSSYYFIDDVCLSHNPATCPARPLDILPPVASCVNGEVVLDAGDGSVHYAWIFDGEPLPCDTSQTIVASRAGWYRVVVGREQSCGSVYTYTDSVFVSGECLGRLKPCHPERDVDVDAPITLPTAFSPNNDGLNDRWPGTIAPLPLRGGAGGGATPPGGAMGKVQIFSRWGTLVYSGLLDQGWDGRAPSGAPAPDGVYMYVYRSPSGQQRTGSITLVR